MDSSVAIDELIANDEDPTTPGGSESVKWTLRRRRVNNIPTREPTRNRPDALERRTPAYEALIWSVYNVIINTYY